MQLKILKKEISWPKWFYWQILTFKVKLTSILHNLSQKTEEEGILSNSFCEVSMVVNQDRE